MKFMLQTPADPFNQGAMNTREVHNPKAALREQYLGAQIREDRTAWGGTTKRWVVTSAAGQTLHAYSWGSG